ncbi:MAG: 50S ribosomal protein L18 [Patescibacteria group bacterium]|jgi:large subunit ribosomal protein L18
MNKKLLLSKQARRQRRQHRVRAKLVGTAERPRLSVRRSLQHISCQLVNDIIGKTIAATSDQKLTGTKTERATAVGTTIAELAKKQGINQVVFDRSSYLYHGRVKALADAARAAGLQF